jgi:hypothetical protein
MRDAIAKSQNTQGGTAMIDAVILINCVIAAMASVFGFCSRNLATAVVAGLFGGLVHAGLIVLVVLQAGSDQVTELPYLRDGIDVAMRSGYFPFAHSRLALYLGATLLIIMIGMVALYLVKWALAAVLAIPMRA